jgi:hypothetical protein
MKLSIAGLATGLLLAGAPAWADSWRNDSGHGWRGNSWGPQARHGDQRWERHDWNSGRHHHGRHSRHWDRHYRRHHPYPAPGYGHRHYRYRDYSYSVPGHVVSPNVYFSWSHRID